MKKLLSILVLMFAIATISAQMILNSSETQVMQATTQSIELATLQVAESMQRGAVQSLVPETVTAEKEKLSATSGNIERPQRAPRQVTPFVSAAEILWPVRNLTATQVTLGNVQLSWEAPQAIAGYEIEEGEFSHVAWAGGGFAIGGPASMAHRYTAAQLIEMNVAGGNLTEVTFFRMNHVQSGADWFLSLEGRVRVSIGVGGTATNPGTIVYETLEVLPSGAGADPAWQSVELTTPVGIPFDQDLWIMVEFFSGAPAGFPNRRFLSTNAQGTQVNGFDNLTLLNGQWVPLNQVGGLATVTGGVGIRATVEYPGSTGADATFLGYQIWRGETLLTPTPITGLTFSDTDAPAGNHVYSVRAIYEEGASQAIAIGVVVPITALPFHEGFENAIPPLGWLNVDIDNTPVLHAGNLWRTWPFTSDAPTQEGDGAIFSFSWNYWVAGPEQGPLPANNWLITPQIHIPAGQHIGLTYWIMSTDPDFLDNYGVYISTTGTAIGTGTATTIGNFTRLHGRAAPGVWTENTIVLSEFAGQSVYIAFRHNHSGGGGIGLDNITIDLFPVAVLSISPEDGATNVVINENIVVTFYQDVTEGPNFGDIAISPAVTNFQANIVGNALTITHDGFDYNTEYTVTIPAGAIHGLDEVTTWQFTTTSAAVTVLGTTPVDNATGVALDANLVVTFNQDVDFANGFSGITITYGGGTVAVTDAQTATRYLTIIHAGFDFETEYTVTIPAGTIDGYDEIITWSFTTRPDAFPIAGDWIITGVSGWPIAEADDPEVWVSEIVARPATEDTFNVVQWMALPPTFSVVMNRDANGNIYIPTGVNTGLAQAGRPIAQIAFVLTSEGSAVLSGTGVPIEILEDGVSFRPAMMTVGGYQTTRIGIGFGFQQTEGGPWSIFSDATAYDLVFTPRVSNDASVIAITAPNSGIGLSNAETVTVIVQNLGLEPISSLPIVLRLGNTDVATETITRAIAVGARDTFTFAATVDLSDFADHTITVFTNLAGDQNRANDTMRTVVTNRAPLPPATVPFFEGFEGTTANNLPEGWTRTGAAVTGTAPVRNAWSTVNSNQSISGVGRPAHAGTRMAASLAWGGTDAINTWMFTPQIAVEAGTTYEISFWYMIPAVNAGGTAIQANHFRVKVGDGPSEGEMTEELFATTQNADEWTLIRVMYQATETRTIHIGFNDHTPGATPGSGFVVFLDDVSIEELAMLQVESTTPANNATGVAVNTPISVTFTTEPTQQGAIASGVTVTPPISGGFFAVVYGRDLIIQHEGLIDNARHTVTIADGTIFGLSGEFSWSFVVGDATSIEIPTTTTTLVTFYPNPVDDILHIETTETVRRIEIFNLQGTLVMTVEGNATAINVSNLPSGTYMIRFTTETGVSTQRFVKR